MKIFINKFNINYGIVNSYKVLIQVILVAHIFSCLWMFYGYIQNNYWIEFFKFQDYNLVSIYFKSLYYTTMIMTTVGYGNIHATNFNEYILCIFYFIIGAMVFVIYIGLTSSI